MKKKILCWSRFNCILGVGVFLSSFIFQQSFVFSQPLANGQNKFLGNVIGYNGIHPNFPTYWNQVTPENHGKWGNVETSLGSYNWGGLDDIYNYAVTNGFLYKHHNLVWGQQYPGFIGSLDSAQLAQEIENWIKLSGERYPKANFVDVVNEPLHAFTGGTSNPYGPNLVKALGGTGSTGWDWVIKAFQLARQYWSPNAKLILNEYSILQSSTATSNLLTIINLLKARGLIDGIGIQGHYFEGMSTITASTLNTNLNSLAATGLPIYISEFEVDEANDSTQLAKYQLLFTTLWNHPGVKGITLWGYVQGEIWKLNGYLIRNTWNGSERPAMQWLRQFLATGNFQSYQTGNWNDVNSWTRFDGTNWIHPAPHTPQRTEGSITIVNGHTITVSASDSAAKLTVASGATLIVNPSVTLSIKDDYGTDLTVNGTLIINGILARDTASTIFMGNGGKYIHQQNGGSIPIATWGAGSTCEISGVTNTMPSNTTQNFYNLVWNCPGQSSNLNLGGQIGTAISGTLTVANTNWDHASTINPMHQLQLFSGAGSYTINSIVVNGYNAVLAAQVSAFVDTVIVGDITLSKGGMLSASNQSSGVTGYFVKGNFIVEDSAYIGKSDAANDSKFVFCKRGTQTLHFPASGVSFVGAPTFIDSAGTTLNLGMSVIGGSGSFQVQNGATVQTGHPNGINGNIFCTGSSGGGNSFSTSANYVYNGTVPQVTGTMLPATVATLTVNNSAGVTLSNSMIVSTMVDMKNGVLSSGSNTLTYGSSGVLRYSGNATQTTSSGEFPITGGPKDLSITNLTGVSLHASRTITGNLDLSGNLILGSNNFTTSSITNATRTKYIHTNGIGALRFPAVGSTPSLFPVGTRVGYAPANVTNTGIGDTIGVSVVDDTSDTPRVLAKWNISESVPGGGNYTLQFNWIYYLMNDEFVSDRPGNARIYHLPDTMEVGTGVYTAQLDYELFSISRSGITTLGSFAVGGFRTPVTEVKFLGGNLPTKFTLGQNYPNPFNPSTTISFDLPKQTMVRLTIYDIRGSEVATLMNEERPAGRYSLQWNAENLSSGIYFYRIVTNEFMQTRKLLLMK